MMLEWMKFFVRYVVQMNYMKNSNAMRFCESKKPGREKLMGIRIIQKILWNQRRPSFGKMLNGQ